MTVALNLLDEVKVLLEYGAGIYYVEKNKHYMDMAITRAKCTILIQHGVANGVIQSLLCAIVLLTSQSMEIAILVGLLTI